MYLIPSDAIFETGIAIRIQIVSPHKAMLFSCRYSKWSHAGHDIADSFSGLKSLNQALVFGFQATVPIDLRVVEPEYAVRFLQFHSQVVFAGQQFVAKSAIFIFLANFVDLVDDGADMWSFVHEDFGNQLLIW